MESRILGPLEVAEGSRPIPVAGARQGALLALLLLHGNEVVSSNRLLEELWGGEASERSQNALQQAVSRLRKALGRERLERDHPATCSESSRMSSTESDSSASSPTVERACGVRAFALPTTPTRRSQRGNRPGVPQPT